MKQKFKIILIIVGSISFKPIFSQSNALNFDGIDDYVNLDAVATVMANSTNFTIEFWMKADLNNQSSSIRTSLFSINPQTSNGNGLLIILGGEYTQEGKLMIYDEGTWGVNSDFTSNIVIGDNNCHHISYVRNGNTGIIYIDGVNVGSHTSTYTLSATDLYSIGQEWDNLTTTPSSSQFYNGEIDELRIWNTARTINQIQTNMNNELIGNEVGLVAYYNFNQGISSGNNSGVNTLIDNTVNGLNGTLYTFALNGTISNWILNQCSIKPIFSQSNALNFDGIDDYVNLDAVATVMANSTNFTIEFWMKADLNNQSSSIRTSLFSINPQTSSENGLLIILGGEYTQEGKLMIYDEGAWGVNSDFTSNIVIGDNNCHHISYVRNGNTGIIYIDGVNVGSHTSTYTLSATDLYSIGQEWDNLTTTPSSSQFYNGEIDELRIWNTARTINQIQTNMNNELIGNEVGLVAYYNFNQGISSGNNSGVNTLIDNTVNGLNGTLYTFALNGTISNWILNQCSITTTSTNNILLEKITVKTFPNPASHQLKIVSDELTIREINIIDNTGKTVKKITQNLTVVNVADLLPGIYFVELISEEKIIIQKFVKQ